MVFRSERKKMAEGTSISPSINQNLKQAVPDIGKAKWKKIPIFKFLK